MGAGVLGANKECPVEENFKCLASAANSVHVIQTGNQRQQLLWQETNESNLRQVELGMYGG